jgi:hypothetical protein
MTTLVPRIVEWIRVHRGASVAVLLAIIVSGVGVNLGLRHAAGDARADIAPTRDRAETARLELKVARFELSAARGSASRGWRSIAPARRC